MLNLAWTWQSNIIFIIDVIKWNLFYTQSSAVPLVKC